MPRRLTLGKTWASGSPSTATTSLTLSGGTYSSSAVAGTNSNDGNAANDTLASISVANSDVIYLGESLTGYAKSYACSAGTVDQYAGSVTLPDALSGDVTCTITNTPPAPSLSITKTNNQTIYAQGQPVTYTVVVSNANTSGVGTAFNAVFTDPAITGLSMTGVTCGSATGSASCPTTANTTVMLMQGSGIIIPSIPPGDSVTFTITGIVSTNASGNLSNVASVTAAGTTVSATDTDTPQSAMSICSTTMYLSQGSGGAIQLNSLNTSANPFTFTPIGSTTATTSGYNAIGVHPRTASSTACARAPTNWCGSAAMARRSTSAR